MKRSITAAVVPGLAVAGLRAWLYAVALDEKNLLIPFHPLELLLWAVTAVTVATLLWWARKRSSACGEAPSGRIAALGCFALALALVPEVLSLRGNAFTLMEKLSFWGGALCVPGMFCAGISQLRRKAPFFAFHALLCVWICLHLVVTYRVWSGDPQLMDYVFPMLANVCLGLFAYQVASWEAGSFSAGGVRFWGLMSLFFCAASLGSADSLFYAAGAVWALTNVCRLSPVSGNPGESGKEL